MDVADPDLFFVTFSRHLSFFRSLIILYNLVFEDQPPDGQFVVGKLPVYFSTTNSWSKAPLATSSSVSKFWRAHIVLDVQLLEDNLSPLSVEPRYRLGRPQSRRQRRPYVEPITVPAPRNSLTLPKSFKNSLIRHRCRSLNRPESYMPRPL